MKTDLRRKYVALAFGLPVLCFSAHSTLAAPTGPLPCGGEFGTGGCAPYGQVIYGTGGNDGSLYEYDSAVLNHSVAGPTANVSGMVDLASGQLKVFAQGIEDGNPSTGSGGYMIASATDVFTLHSTLSGMASFTVVLTANGVGSIANYGYSGQVSLQLGVPGGGGGGYDRGVYQGGVTVPHGTPFSLLSTLPGREGSQLMATDTHLVALNTPFSLGYSLRADVMQGTVFDLTNTGYLSFILPEGVSITSMGGYGTAVIPLPAAVWLFGSGLLTLAGFTLRGRRQHVINQEISD